MKGYTVPELIIAILFFVCIPGWVMNFQNLVQYELLTKQFVLSLIGVFVPPLGAFTGWAF